MNREIIAWALFAFGGALDLLSLFLTFRKFRRGVGASGLPLLPWVLYAAAILLPSTLYLKLELFLTFTFLHLLCQFIIPVIGNRRLDARQR